MKITIEILTKKPEYNNGNPTLKWEHIMTPENDEERKAADKEIAQEMRKFIDSIEWSKYFREGVGCSFVREEYSEPGTLGKFLDKACIRIKNFDDDKYTDLEAADAFFLLKKWDYI